MGINVRDAGEPLAGPIARGIELDGVTFGYEAGSDVLRGVSYAFEAGKAYAVAGASGSGKSTLLSLLMGAHAGYAGEIRYDGRQLRGISGESIYDAVTLIQQSVFVFNASIRDNITMFRDFPDADVERAIKLSGLSALIAERGEDYLCGENGSGLSGGEKQRIAIARSLLRKAQVLLCDEVTAALDRQTADQVTDAILSLDGMTRIAVTHALDARQLRRFDAVIAMKGGEIAETGTFDGLMAANGYFYSLYTLAQ